MFDPIEFFDHDDNYDPEAAAAPAEAAPALETPAPAAAEPAPATPAAPAAPVAETDEEFKGAPAGYVPYAALKEAREKTKAESLKRQTLEDVVAARNATPPAAAQPSAPVQVPEPYTPEYADYINQQLQATNLNSALNLSESRAVVKYGADAVKELQTWAGQKDEFFFQRILASPDAYETAKQEFDREQAATKYAAIDQTQFAAFQKWQAEQANTPAVVAPAAVAPSVHAAQQAAAAQEGLQKPVSSGTISNSPSAGGTKVGETPASPGNAFAAVFN